MGITIGFDAEKDGFPFPNWWVLDEDELQVFQEMGEAALGRLLRLFVVGTPMHIVARRSVGSIAATLGHVLKEQTYGLCGGMAYAAADCFVHRIPIPWEDKEGENPAPGDPLRLYLWKRQIRSFRNDLDRFVKWLVYLNWVPKLIGGGPSWLAKASRVEWGMLQAKLNAREPVPLGLVRDTRSPFECHQVLAVGYDEPDAGHRAIEIYDPNCPQVPSTITFALEGKALKVQESCKASQDLMGFFCDDYEPVDPRPYL